MSQQINLYDPSLLRKRELLTALNLAAGSAGLIVVLGIWGGIARSQLSALEQESRTLDPQVKAFQTQKDILTAQLAAMKPDPQIEAELASARALLDLHTRQVGELKKGVGAESGGFAEYLRGFARQTPSGLWLTGFSVSDGGVTMEIRGRMTDPALLPEYIRRLNGEQAFKGREFSALKLSMGKPDETASAPPVPAASAPALSPARPSAHPAPAPSPAAANPSGSAFYEFLLAPKLRSPTSAGAASGDAARSSGGALR